MARLRFTEQFENEIAIQGKIKSIEEVNKDFFLLEIDTEEAVKFAYVQKQFKEELRIGRFIYVQGVLNSILPHKEEGAYCSRILFDR